MGVRFSLPAQNNEPNVNTVGDYILSAGGRIERRRRGTQSSLWVAESGEKVLSELVSLET